MAEYGPLPSLSVALMVKLKVPAAIIKLAEARQEARKAKDWDKSDKLRDEIAGQGYTIDDTPGGFVVKPKK